MKQQSIPTRNLLMIILIAALLPAAGLFAQEESIEYPMGPIGARMKIQTDKNYVRVSQVLTGSPAENGGLQVNDFIYGAFGREFDPIGSEYKGKGGVFTGCIRQLGNAIDRAEHGNGSLPLMIMRPGTGEMSLTLPLPATGILTPAHPLTSTKYALAYDHACGELHQYIMNDNDGNVGYLTGFVGLSLLGHPNWNDKTGSTPYRQSLDKIKDIAISRINQIWYAPFESLLLDLYEADGITHKQPSANPNTIPPNLTVKNWELGTLGMFLAEYYTKTEQAGEADPAVFAALQLTAELSANRIQNWKQPPGTTPWGRNPSYESRRGQTGHTHVGGDYMHYDFAGGINMTGVHLFGALALAKRAGVDMTVRPKDGKDFGYGLNPGDPRPAEIADALPDIVTFPRNGEDSAGFTSIAKTASVPANPLELATDPLHYNWDLRQKFWLKWEFLRRSSSSSGYVAYSVGAGAQYDACGRTAGSLFGLMAFTDGVPPTPEDLEQVEKQKAYLANYHEISLNAHTYNSGGAVFYALAAPYLDDRQQRFYLHNWRFRHNFMREHDGTLSYFGGRNYNDSYISVTLSKWVHIALLRSVAIGGLPHIRGYDTNRIFLQFDMPDLSWPTLEARSLIITGTLNTALNAEILDSSGNILDPAAGSVAWSVISGPSTTGIIADPASLVTTATFGQAGIYRLQLQVSHSGKTTTEIIDVSVLPYTLPAGWKQGQANYETYYLTNPGAIADLTSHPNFPDSPDVSSTISNTVNTRGGSDYGSRMSGYIIPTVDGIHSFYVAGNDRAELHLNTTASSADTAADRAGLALVASARSTDPQEWDKSTDQRYDVTLVSGKLYYFEALQVENSGSDHLAVGWTPPGATGIEPISSAFLATAGIPPVETPAILTHPTDQVIALGETASFTLVTEGPELASYQWRRNGLNISTVSTNPTLDLVNAGGALEGTYDCVYSAGDQVIISQSATLSFSDPGFGTVMTGGIWEEEFYGIEGSQVSNLTSSSKYPHMADSSAVITSAEHNPTPTDAGRRWSGWVVPTETANYRFFVTSNNANELWLSPDEYEGHKRLVSEHTGKNNARAWENVTPSDWFQLEAGKRYYIELLHKNNEEDDHAAITWQKWGDPDPVNGDAPIAGSYLQYRLGGYFEDSVAIAPIAVNDDVETDENAIVAIAVTNNDLDNSQSTLTILNFTQPAQGSLTQNGSELVYQPDRDYTGTDSFSYSILNADGLSSNMATVNLSIVEASATLPTTELASSSLTTCFKGNEIFDGTNYINAWEVSGNSSTINEALIGDDLNIHHTTGDSATLDGTDATKSGSGNTWKTANDQAWTFETRLKINANPKGFRLWLGASDNRIFVDIYNDRTQNESGTFSVMHDNLDGAFHVWRVVHDFDRGTYHVWRDAERLTPATGVNYDNSSNDDRLLMGDPTSGSLGDFYNVDIDYVCYDQTAGYLPVGADADGDGLTDTWEHENYGNITAASATADDDGDGRSNLDEFAADTNPFDDSSYLRISSFVSPTENNWLLTIPESSSTRHYTLYQSSDLGASDPWTAVPGQINLPGTDGPLIFNFSNSLEQFYRVEVNAP